MAKKDFKNTSELFITAAAPVVQSAAATTYNEAAPAVAAIPEGYKLVREAKTERLQILLRPTVHEKLKRIAAERGTSKNEIINNLVEEFVKGDE